MKSPKLLWLSCLIFCSQFGLAQPVPMPKLTQPINFDGIVGESEWSQVPKQPLEMFQPNNRAEITEKTDVYLAYDKDYLYMAGRIYHEDMNDVMAKSYKRDVFTYASDYFGILIDSFNDNENALAFAATPLGVRTDFTIFNDAQGAFPLNSTWNTFWDLKTTMDDKGWYCEIRIPFSSLRFNVVDGKSTMGIIYWRGGAKKNFDFAIPGLSNENGPWSIFKPSQGKEFTFEDIESKKPLYLSPYVISGLTQTSELNATEDGYQLNSSKELNAGIDIKYSLSSNLTMDVTFNTDFAQVEADDQQVNLTRFSLFFPEKRMFFQERASIFSFNTGGFNTLFYSRRIGLQDGLTVPIIAGGRLVGRLGKWDLGLLNMQTAKTDDLLSTNHGVVRFRRQLFNPSSYLGGMITNKMDSQSGQGTTVGIDGSIKISSLDYVLFGLVNTFDNSGMSGTPFFNEYSKTFIQWQNRGSKGFGYDFSYYRVGERFDPAMGFELRQDVSNYNGSVWYGWIMAEKSKFRTAGLIFGTELFTRNSDNGLKESANNFVSWDYSTKRGGDGSIKITNSYDNVPEDFSLSDNDVVPMGEYKFTDVAIMASTPRGQPFSLLTNISTGQYYDGKKISAALTADWRPTANFNGLFTYQYNSVDIAPFDINFVAHVARVKGEVSFNPKLSTSTFIQFSDVANYTLINFRLRFNPREGNDLYIVYNEGMNMNREREFPILPVTATRTILIKYTHTFRL